MNKSLVYNVPAKLIDQYRERNVIIRSASPADLIHCLRDADLATVRFIKLLSVSEDWNFLAGSWEPMPVEIVLNDPSADYAQLYNHSKLLDTHPVRIAIPVVPGFSQAVKQAVSLDFAVKLELDQPGGLLITELMLVLELYLHRSTVRQPIEFFQSVLHSFYQDEPVFLWSLAEEDGAVVRYI